MTQQTTQIKPMGSLDIGKVDAIRMVTVCARSTSVRGLIYITEPDARQADTYSQVFDHAHHVTTGNTRGKRKELKQNNKK